MEFEQLQQALLKNRNATAELASTEQPYAYAQALRGQEQPSVGPSGYVSPLSVLANVISKGTGRSKVKELEAKRGGLQQAIAASQGALDNYELEGKALTRTLAQNKDNREDDTLAVHQGNLALNKRKADKRSKGETWKDASGASFAAQQLGDGSYVNATTQEPVPEGSYPAKTSSGYQPRKAMTSKQIDSLKDRRSRAKTLTASVNTFKPEYIQLKGAKTGFVNNFFNFAGKNDLIDMVEGREFKKLDAQTQESMLWWANLMQGYSLRERHDLFGATLTNNEFTSWEQAFAVMRGMDPQTALDRLGALSGRANNMLADDLNVQAAASAGLDNEIGALDELATQLDFQKDENGRYVWGGLDNPNMQSVDQQGNLAPSAAAAPQAPKSIGDYDAAGQARIKQIMEGG